eukprot:1329893-Alexandrium_andersonii.AAC.1
MGAEATRHGRARPPTLRASTFTARATAHSPHNRAPRMALSRSHLLKPQLQRPLQECWHSLR